MKRKVSDKTKIIFLLKHNKKRKKEKKNEYKCNGSKEKCNEGADDDPDWSIVSDSGDFNVV